jgi:hypothetical protein
MREKFLNYIIANGHAPTEICDEEQDGVFYALDRAYDISQSNYIEIVLDGFIAQVGKEAIRFPQLAITVFTISQTTMGPGRYNLQYRGIR